MGEDGREIATTLEPVLLRILDRLIDQIREANKVNTYLSTLPNELFPNPSEYMFEVSPGEQWSFDPGHMTGAGKNALHAVGSVKITIHHTGQLDQAGRDTEYLTGSVRGVMRLVTKVLDALSNHELADSDERPLLSQPLQPKAMYIPPKDDRRKGFVTIEFSCEFDWHVTQEIFQ